MQTYLVIFFHILEEKMIEESFTFYKKKDPRQKTETRLKM